MKREKTRLAAKLGPTHPRVAEIDNRLQLNAAMMRDLKLEAARARTKVPQVDSNNWVLHGYVRDKAHEPAPNLTVALFDANGGGLSGIDQGCTDANGYYKIVATNISAPTSAPAYLRVLSKTGSVLHADSVALTPAPGVLNYREIILSGEESVCVPPPEPPSPPSPTFGPPPPPTGSGTGAPTGSGTGSPTPTTGSSQTESLPRDYWVVRGRVTNKSGTGISGVFVTVYDKDLFFDDRLGQAETDANGNYSLTYRSEDFRDLIEKKPDLYLKVIDKQGKTLRTVEHGVSYEAGRVETIDIQISG